MDKDTNTVVLGDNKRECRQLNPYYTACKIILTPENKRFGMLFSEGARGFLTHKARWIATDEI